MDWTERRALTRTRRDRLAELQFILDEELLTRAQLCAKESRFDELAQLRASTSLDWDDPMSAGAPDVFTKHDWVLDKWRVGVTLLLVLVLFAVVFVLVLEENPSDTVTPYVSLLSGLAGIALGWMFASAGGTASGNRTRQSRPDATNDTVTE